MMKSSLCFWLANLALENQLWSTFLLTSSNSSFGRSSGLFNFSLCYLLILVLLFKEAWARFSDSCVLQSWWSRTQAWQCNWRRAYGIWDVIDEKYKIIHHWVHRLVCKSSTPHSIHRPCWYWRYKWLGRRQCKFFALNFCRIKIGINPIAAALNDNTKGKSSRYKLTQTLLSFQDIGYAIVCILAFNSRHMYFVALPDTP